MAGCERCYEPANDAEVRGGQWLCCNCVEDYDTARRQEDDDHPYLFSDHLGGEALSPYIRANVLPVC